MRSRSAILGLTVACLYACPAVAQDADDPAKQEAEKSESPPTLDELLGLADSEESRGEDRELPLNDPTQNELDRKLEGKQVSEAFLEAVTLMGETAQRLDAARDTGITTQRLQEEIIRKLDQVIESAQQNQSQSSSSSSSSPQQQPDQQQQQQQSQNPQNSESNDSQEAPSRQDGQLSAQGAGNSAAWGALRAHIRDSLVQGTSDPFSSLYRSLTEDFYKRLAEEDGR